MLDTKMAKKIVNKISQTMNYAITIINLDGTIIASKDENRIGLPHPIAGKMIAEKREMDIVTMNNVTEHVRLGVCLCVCYDGKVIGVLEIAGNPEEILSLSYIIRLSAETIIEYEIFKEKIRIRSDKKEMFLSALLNQTDISDEKLQGMAEGMDINVSLPRTAILIDCPDSREPEHLKSILLRTITENSLHSHQDITSVTPEGEILVFKTIDSSLKKSVSEFRAEITLYCEEAAKLLLQKHGITSVYFYAGSLQREIGYYRLSLQHSKWLKNHGSAQTVDFFIDQLTPFMQSQLPASVFPPVFSIYALSMSEEEKKQFIEIGDALCKSRMNLTQCARLLYVHRNTLTMKMNKIRQSLGIDPIGSLADQQFFLHFLFYLKSTIKRF